jgi:hypothetical protein
MQLLQLKASVHLFVFRVLLAPSAVRVALVAQNMHAGVAQWCLP